MGLPRQGADVSNYDDGAHMVAEDILAIINNPHTTPLAKLHSIEASCRQTLDTIHCDACGDIAPGCSC